MFSKLFPVVLAGASIGLIYPSVHAADEQKQEQKSEEGETKVKLEDCPKPVQETIKSAVGNGSIKEIVTETEGGKLIYSVDATIDNKPYEINVSKDGTLISKEIEKEDSGKEKK